MPDEINLNEVVESIPDFSLLDFSDLKLEEQHKHRRYEFSYYGDTYSIVDFYSPIKLTVRVNGIEMVFVARLTNFYDHNELIQKSLFFFDLRPKRNKTETRNEILISLSFDFFTERMANFLGIEVLAESTISKTKNFPLKGIGIEMYKKMQKYIQFMANLLGKTITHKVRRVPLQNPKGKELSKLDEKGWEKIFLPLLVDYIEEIRDSRVPKKIWVKEYKPTK